MLFTYTAVVPDPEAKLLLLPLLSGFQSITTAWLKPYANSQNQILDFVDVYLGTVRFILFSCIAALLILRPGERPTHALAACCCACSWPRSHIWPFTSLYNSSGMQPSMTAWKGRSLQSSAP